ncbi:MAG: hypothetical protein JWQ74_1454 [Marmoricola sp.]|nr:hypothetical protein [Marmoricola sp.]
MKDHISKSEIRKDAIQDGVEAVTSAVGQGTQIVIGAVSEIAKTVGGLATDLFEIREASKRAAADAGTATVEEIEAEGAFPIDPSL